MQEQELTVGDMIKALSILNPDLKVVIPGAPYDQPRFVDRIGVVILKEDDGDTGVPAGEYIGIGIGNDFDELFDEEDSLDEEIVAEHEEIIEYEEPIEAETFEEFQAKAIEKYATKKYMQ